MTDSITGKVTSIRSITIIAYSGQRSYLELHAYFTRLAYENHEPIPIDLHMLEPQDFDEATDEYESATIFSQDTVELIEKIRQHKDYNRADTICIY